MLWLSRLPTADRAVVESFPQTWVRVFRPRWSHVLWLASRLSIRLRLLTCYVRLRCNLLFQAAFSFLTEELRLTVIALTASVTCLDTERRTFYGPCPVQNER